MCRSIATPVGAEAPRFFRPDDPRSAKIQRLGDLPKANKEIAVLRMVGGCQVPVVVSYQVEGDGSFAAGR